MPEFTNLKDLARYVGTNSGGVLLSRPEMKAILKLELERLEDYIKEELQVYFDSYKPTVYKRTGNTERSITLNAPFVDGKDLCAEITFDDTLANHPSVMNSKNKQHPDGYTPWLLQRGWNITDSVQPRVDMFTDHPGSQYITKAVKRFNDTNKYGIQVAVFMNGEEIQL